MEQGQAELFNILKAYSLHDLEVGYCQGMGFVAGILLFYLPRKSGACSFGACCGVCLSLEIGNIALFPECGACAMDSLSM